MNEKFEIGDDVICIDDRSRSKAVSPPVVYKKVYKVLDIQNCSDCGALALDVGLSTAEGRENEHTKCGCKGEFSGKGIHWCGAFRFAKHTKQSAEKSDALVKLEPKKVLEELEILSN